MYITVELTEDEAQKILNLLDFMKTVLPESWHEDVAQNIGEQLY